MESPLEGDKKSIDGATEEIRTPADLIDNQGHWPLCYRRVSALMAGMPGFEPGKLVLETSGFPTSLHPCVPGQTLPGCNFTFDCQRPYFSGPEPKMKTPATWAGVSKPEFLRA